MKFSILGDPIGKQRARTVNVNGFSRTYTPSQTVNYENLIKLEYQRQCHSQYYEAHVPIRMILDIYLQPAKSDSKKKREAKLGGKIRPTKKPDCSNVLKAVEDALNGIAYADDSQIVSTAVEKYYAVQPRVDVEIVEVET